MRTSTVSMFNTQAICMPCKDKEKVHPKYEEAAAIETAHVERGDYNFPGVGLPEDLS